MFALYKAKILVLLKPKFFYPWRIKIKPKKVLDIGVANNSYEEAKLVYPDCEYTGVDYADIRVQLQKRDSFCLADLETDSGLSRITGYYDLIIINHVLEHLSNGELVFHYLLGCLNKNGVLYAEFPSIRTARNIKSRCGYHFHDDGTHKKFYSLVALANSAISEGCKVISVGPVSTPLKDFLSIPRAILGILTRKGYGPYLIHLFRKVDHIFIRKS